MASFINLSAIPFLFAFIGSILFVAIPLFILKLGVTDPFVLALAGISFQICYLTFCILHSVFSKYINRKKAIITVAILYPIIILGFILTKKLPFIFFLCAFHGIAMSMFWPTYESHITVNVDQCQMAKNLQGFNVGWGSGVVLGCLMGGILFSINMRGAFYFAFIISLLAIYIVFRHIREASIGRIYNNKSSIKEENSLEVSTTKNSTKPFLAFAWIASFAVWFCIGIIIWLFPKFATDRGISPSIIGFLRATQGIFQVIMFFILGLYHRWQYSFLYLIIYELVLILAFVILIISPSIVWWTLAFALMGISAGFIYSSSLFYSSQARTEKVEKTGLHEAVLMSGILFGTFSGGIIAKMMSASATYSMCIGVIIACIVLQVFMRSLSRP
ncbi:MAG: MFS transporter [Candidatus Omnitrophica bacterium]|nr:MFS transporter [Candidatus Omnitrophota bacterium]